jgi:hypothetical protein
MFIWLLWKLIDVLTYTPRPNMKCTSPDAGLTLWCQTMETWRNLQPSSAGLLVLRSSRDE